MFTFPVDLTLVTAIRRWTQGFYLQVQKKEREKNRLDSPLTFELCFTITLSHCEYNLVAPDEATSQLWFTTLDKLIPLIRTVRKENQYYM